MMPLWLFLILDLLGIVLLAHFVTPVAFSREQSYQSPTTIGGQPLLSYGFVAQGAIASGARATGVIALSLGGAAFDIAALAALARGWRAVGGLAIGRAAWRLVVTVTRETAWPTVRSKPAAGKRNS